MDAPSGSKITFAGSGKCWSCGRAIKIAPGHPSEAAQFEPRDVGVLEDTGADILICCECIFAAREMLR